MPSILVVDDEAFMREGIGMIFSKNGFDQVLCAEDGDDALSILQSQRIDGMVLDIKMPRMSGIELLEAIRDQNLHMPITYILSSYDDFSYAQAAIPFGVSEYILKPLVPERAVEFCKKMLVAIEEHQKSENDKKVFEQSVKEREWAYRQGDMQRLLDGNDTREAETILRRHGFFSFQEERLCLLTARMSGPVDSPFLLKLEQEFIASFSRSIRQREKLFHAAFFPIHGDETYECDVVCILGHERRIPLPKEDIRLWLDEHTKNLKTNWHIVEGGDADSSSIGKFLRNTVLQMGTCGYKHSYFVYRIADYIEEHLAEDLRSEDLSRIFRYSSNYIGQMFKVEFGCSLNDYINKKRIEHAKKYLRHETLTVSEIAYKVGYNDVHYFCTLFKRYVGITPKQFRILSLHNVDF